MKVLVHAKPNAKQPGVEKIDDRTFRVAVHEPAHEGRANQAVLRALAKQFGVPQRCVLLIAGTKSRRKVVEIRPASQKKS
ncbi:MAG: DUF167 domain-containing protein [bacterium]